MKRIRTFLDVFVLAQPATSSIIISQGSSSCIRRKRRLLPSTAPIKTGNPEDIKGPTAIIRGSRRASITLTYKG